MKIALALAALCLGPVASALTLGLAGGYQHINYAEKLDAPLKSTQNGWLPSVSGGLGLTPASGAFLLQFSANYAKANLRYDGTTQPPEATPITSTDPHSFLVLESRVGVGLGAISRSKAFLYTGASYRIWHRDLANPGETYRLLSIPVGLRIEPAPESFSIGLDLSARWMIRGSVDVVFADTYDASRVIVKPDYGARAELPIVLLGGPHLRLMLTPWAEYSRIKESSAVTLTTGGQPVTQDGQDLQILEPSSQTTQYGASLGLEASF